MTRNPFKGWFRVILGCSLSDEDTRDAVDYAQRHLDPCASADFRAVREGRKSAEDLDRQVIEKARVLMERYIMT